MGPTKVIVKDGAIYDAKTGNCSRMGSRRMKTFGTTPITITSPSRL